jgi:hypothetical protein
MEPETLTVTGRSASSNFPTTPGAIDSSLGGYEDVIVTTLDATGSSLVYSTYLGGNSDDQAYAIAVDGAQSAYVTGWSYSTDFPTTANVFDRVRDSSEAFVTKFSPSGLGLTYSTYLGGSSAEEGRGIGVDANGNAYVGGRTYSSDFPITANALDATFNGGLDDTFVTKLNVAGSGLSYSTYLGGNSYDEGEALALDAAGNAYLAGATSSTDLPTTPGAFDRSYNGRYVDAFVSKLAFRIGPPATLTLSPKIATNTVGARHCVTAGVRDSSGNPTPDRLVRYTVTGSVTKTGSAFTDGSGRATFCYRGPELPGSDSIRAFADSDRDGFQDADEPGDSAAKTWALPASTPGCEVGEDGKITADDGDPASFDGDAAATATDVRGEQEYHDRGPAANVNVKSTSLEALVCSSDRKRATIFGKATINGAGSFYFKIEVQDLGEPGAGIDTYRILLSHGYDSGRQTLEEGNVQIGTA